MELNTFISRLFEAAQAAGVAPAEAACSQSDSFQVRVRRGELEDYQVSERLSLTLRGQVNGRIGTASTQAVTEESIPLLIQGVLESAALIETDEQDAILPPDDSYSSVCNASQAVTAITAEQKIALARDIDAKLRSDDPRLTPDTCAVATGEETFTLKNTLGLDLSHHSNMIYAMADVVARDGEHAATNYEIRWGYGLDAIDAEELAESCKREALLKLEAGRMKSGAYPVVIKNTAMADLLATFCGVFSADNAQKGLSLLAGREGEAVASASVTLTDDPLMPMGLASCPFDREGAATKTKAVIEGGVLKTLLHNRKTAKKAGCRTTGNAAGAGRVAPTNLFFRPGKLTQEELLANLGDGLYLTEVSGLHAGANPISGDFSLLSRGFEIKGGRVVRAVEEFTVAGNFYQLLKDITDVGGDLLFEAVPMTGDEPISVELRSSSTGGLSSTETGQRPTGGAGEPEDYETENVTVHGLSARLYRILPAEGASPQVQHGCGLWFYRESDPVHFHQVSIPEGAAALVWVDERANCLFLLIGGQSRQELVSVAESMYESERS